LARFLFSFLVSFFVMEEKNNNWLFPTACYAPQPLGVDLPLPDSDSKPHSFSHSAWGKELFAVLCWEPLPCELCEPWGPPCELLSESLAPKLQVWLNSWVLLEFHWFDDAILLVCLFKLVGLSCKRSCGDCSLLRRRSFRVRSCP